jgi:hypothetical protein
MLWAGIGSSSDAQLTQIAAPTCNGMNTVRQLRLKDADK